MNRICCYFNYAPLYRESIYRLIDQEFDCQYYFGREVQEGKKSGIKKISYSVFNREPIEFKNISILNKFSWRTKAATLAFKPYDTFLITGDFVYSYIPLILLSKLMGKRVYGWGHGLKNRKGKMRVFNDFFYRNLTGFFVYGEKGRQRLIDLGYKPDKFHVIYNSLGPRMVQFPDLKSEIYLRHFNNDYPVIIFIGRLTPQKKLDWLIRAHGKHNNCGCFCNLVLIGTGSEMSKLKQIAQDEGFAHLIWFYGECYDNNVTAELLYNATVCASPGNVGLTAIDSMRNGTPVISHGNFETQMPEFEVIVDGKTGILYEEGNFYDFCLKMRDLLSLAQDNRDVMRQNCLTMINEKWNSDNQIEIVKRVLADNAD